jgi:predicted O-methyltransferase YrrM
MQPNLSPTEDILQQVKQMLPPLGGWCPVDKARMLVNLLFKTTPDLCVEIGVFDGASLFPQAFALQHLGRGRVIGVDPWDNPAALDEMQEPANREFWSRVNLEQIYQQVQGRIARYGLTEHCVLMRHRAEDVVSDVPDGIGVLHIDGNHSELHSYQDAVNYLPKVKVNGYIVFDDANWNEMGKYTTHKAMQYLLDHQCKSIGSVGETTVMRKFG